MTAPLLSVAARLRLGEFLLDASFTSDAAITALFGPSGAGKSTLLHLVAGILMPEHGRIAIGEHVLVETARSLSLPPSRRRVGLVFQDAQLFPHLTVRQNIAFGRWFAPKEAAQIETGLVVDTLGIRGLLDRRPSKLSGGEKQRVALARALLMAPRMLLLDEPLSSLDDARRSEILTLIEQIRDRFNVPMLYVTHRRDEVRRLAGHVILIDRGRVTASGAPSEVLTI